MKDLLTGLALVAAAVAALTVAFVSTDLTNRQNKLADKGMNEGEALTQARRTVKRRRYVYQLVPCLAAVAFSIAALFVHNPPK